MAVNQLRISCSGLALGVQRLHGDGRVGRHGEVGRAVLGHGHGAQHAPHVPRAVHAHVVLDARRAVVVEVVGEEPELLDRAARDAPEPARRRRCPAGRRSPSRLARLTRSGIDRRARRLPHRDGLEQHAALFLAEQEHVVEHVDQVDAPPRLRRRLAGDEEVLVAQRIGVEELRPGGVDQVVHHDRLDRLAPAGDALHDAPRPGAGPWPRRTARVLPPAPCRDAR